MCHLLLSDVQSTNLQFLYAILVGTERDMVETCRKFNLHAAQAERLRTLTPAGVWSLVHAVGQMDKGLPQCDDPRWPAGAAPAAGDLGLPVIQGL